MVKKPLVSVCMITYNHDAFINQAIEGVLMQETDFDIELIIADDASPDQTKSIVEGFINNNSKSILISYTKHSQNKGMMSNFIWALKQCKGKYIALCEGDDFWTDPYKLQKQVDFLESNLEFVICAHQTETLVELENTKIPIHQLGDSFELNINSLIISNSVSTCSLLFRKEFINPLPDWFKLLSFGDWGLQLLLLERSKKNMFVMKDIMACYRIHSGGIHGSLHKNAALKIRAYQMHLDFYEIIEKHLLFDFSYCKNLHKARLIKLRSIQNLASSANLYGELIKVGINRIFVKIKYRLKYIL